MQQAALKDREIPITFSYWDGSGGQRKNPMREKFCYAHELDALVAEEEAEKLKLPEVPQDELSLPSADKTLKESKAAIKETPKKDSNSGLVNVYYDL
uniref:Uncharacterized protein n=1 Tax=Glossina morsitans morsitans TaxID=37546 RepID=A0A1B0G9E1_GLOMM